VCQWSKTGEFRDVLRRSGSSVEVKGIFTGREERDKAEAGKTGFVRRYIFLKEKREKERLAIHKRELCQGLRSNPAGA
jgi:hypothetical protein